MKKDISRTHVIVSLMLAFFTIAFATVAGYGNDIQKSVLMVPGLVGTLFSGIGFVVSLAMFSEQDEDGW